ncbi:hypothetical protein COU15_01635 [Candidatus Kaiserbacteria bacterium CG10_big_fil_rev_8_21_14_0_10_45_20]|uniref:Uncharacterized protein n=1 Tax=Candidatus Kaiserbacteria bacterium CG10_big_fil_rev_8_21_14_0_10_45_20 TaxID=1974607 RepID=A0A2H0UFT2_9BACT|nr:MAG: hypothetical protein COU15_01635 [Candidatus Kaiserbacteria bacterium CG10_big_fil_rev_8_21_14_0_10_45_20]
MNKTLSAVSIIFVLLVAVLGVYYFYTYPQAEEVPELTNPALLSFPGSQTVLYKDYFKNKDDSRLTDYEVVIDYASRNGEEVALVKSDINATETLVLRASAGEPFSQLYVADGGEKRMVDISPTGAYIAYSFFSGGIREGVFYGDVNDWQTRIVNTASGYIEQEIPGYAPQFITDNILLVGTSGGILLYDMGQTSFKETGLRFMTPVGMVPFRVDADSSHIVALDLNADMYHMLSINTADSFSLTYLQNIPLSEGTLVGSDENTMLFVSKFEDEDFLVSARRFNTILVADPLYQAKNI